MCSSLQDLSVGCKHRLDTDDGVGVACQLGLQPSSHGPAGRNRGVCSQFPQFHVHIASEVIVVGGRSTWHGLVHCDVGPLAGPHAVQTPS